MVSGNNPYLARSPEGRPYIYPPLTAVAFAPTAAVGLRASAVLWLLIEWAAILVLFALSLRIAVAEAEPAGRLFGVAFVGLLVLFRAFDSEMMNGQLNAPVAALCVGALWTYARGRPRLSGWLLAASVSVKLYTAPLALLYLRSVLRDGRGAEPAAAPPRKNVGRRRDGLRALAHFVLGAAALGLGPALVFGARGCAWLQSYWSNFLGGYAGAGPQAYHAAGQSLYAALLRFLTPTNAAAHAEEAIYVNILSLPQSAVWTVHLCLAGAFAVWFLTRRGRTRPLADGLLLLVASLLFAPIARKAAFVLLLPVIAAAFVAIPRRGGGVRRSVVVPWALAAAALTLTGESLLGRRAAEWSLALGCWCWASLLLGALPAWRLVPRRDVGGGRNCKDEEGPVKSTGEIL